MSMNTGGKLTGKIRTTRRNLSRCQFIQEMYVQQGLCEMLHIRIGCRARAGTSFPETVGLIYQTVWRNTSENEWSTNLQLLIDFKVYR